MPKLLGYTFALLSMLGIMFATNAALCLTGICEFGLWDAFYVMVLGTLFLILVDMIVAIVVQRIPQKLINPNAWCFKVFKFERGFYERIRIRKWKDKIPELGGVFKKFSKQHLTSNTPEYVHHFIVETIYGEMSHTWSIVAGLLVFVVFPQHILNFALPLFLINLILNILPAMIQRYTRPKLCKMYVRLLEKEKEMMYNDDISMLPNNS